MRLVTYNAPRQAGARRTGTPSLVSLFGQATRACFTLRKVVSAVSFFNTHSSSPRATQGTNLLAVWACAAALSACVAASPRSVAPASTLAIIDKTLSTAPAQKAGVAYLAPEDAASQPVDSPSEPLPAAVPLLADLRDAVRRQDWQKARDYLQEFELDGIGGEYLLARVAFETGGLDEAIPRYRNLTAIRELDFVSLELRSALARQGDLATLSPRDKARVHGDDWLLAAERLIGEGRSDEATRLIEQASRSIRGAGNSAVRLRAARADNAWATGNRFRAYTDWRWLATRAPESPLSENALFKLELHFANQPLKPEEWQSRTNRLVDAGRVDALPSEFSRWAASGRGPSYGAKVHYVGQAYYSARNYPLAARYLLESAELRNAYSFDDRYYAARALSRIGHQSSAIEQFEKIRSERPKHSKAKLSALNIARELSLAGRFGEAVSAYSDFLREYPGSEDQEAAMRERGVARFASGDFQGASFEFQRTRALFPNSRLSGLYRHLSGLSLLHAERTEEALALFAEGAARPLSFDGLVSRLRLVEMGQAVPLVAPTDVAGGLPQLPALATEFDDVGLFEEAEKLLSAAEATIRDGRFARYQAECLAHSQLFAGRRELLLGISAAANNNYYVDPEKAPRWVWRCLNPEPFGDWVAPEAKQFGIPKSLTYAIMRQESGFRPSVVSPADAHGLMQVIPPTGREIALALGDDVDAIDGDALKNPYRSIRYGSYYLGQLSKAFAGHPALIAAGYNAGPHSAGLWFAAGQRLPLELFVARIPFDETRGYVMQVLSNLAAYQLLDPDLGNVDIPLSFR